ncbi:unnamed protein product [Peronospora farinosa]|uniref:Saposin B-type domain-containing protein n=1 Tax=Peronospora farinosa TaxID=134698 RepID=A0ABN8C7A0_9STRA|nr:unnamed protein product [Peronospora farinosa]
MRPVHALLLLLLSLVATSAIASAERGMRYNPDVMDDDVPIPQEKKTEIETETASGLIAALTEHFHQSSAMVQSFLGFDSAEEVVRIVVIEEEKEDPALERKTACLKAMEIMHKQEELKQETETFMKYIRSAFDMVSLKIWGGPSCNDLDRLELVDQCNLVLKSEDAVQLYLLEDKTDDQVCDIMSVVSDLDTKNNLSCQLCQRFVQMVDQAVSQEMQQVEQVREIIGDLCDAMSTDSMCHTFLKNYDAIVDWVKHGTDSLVVCLRLTMCSADSSSSHGNNILNLALTPDEPPAFEDGALVTADFQEQNQSCFFCTRATEVIYHVNILLPDQLSMIKSMLPSVCQMALPVSRCQNVEANFDRIVKLVQEGLDPHEVCENANFCSKAALLDMPPMRGNDKTCVYCDAATTVVEVILQEAPEQINEIREYADMICGILGEDSPCHQYVTQLDTVVDALNKGAHPREICKMLKYCSAESMDSFSQSDESPRVGVMRNGLLGDDHSVSMDGPEGRHGRVGDGLHHGSCFFCTRVATAVHYVNRASPEKVPIVKTILSNVCQLVPSKFKCDVVDKNFDKIVELDKEGKHPHEICESLGVCKKLQHEEENFADDPKGVTVATQWPSGNETQCTYCQFATTVAKIALEQYGADIREVRAYADMICDMLGEDNPCHDYVKQFDFVIDSITKGMTSKAICVGLKFCTATIVDGKENALMSSTLLAFSVNNLIADGLAKNSMEASSDRCFVCTQVASVMEVAVAEDPSQIAQIRQIADVVCFLMPSDNQCQSFVKKFDTIVDSLQKGEQPNAICHDLQYCTASSDPAMANLAVPDMIAVQNHEKGSSTCAYCNGVVSVLKYALDQKPDKVKEMRKTAGIVCDLLPPDDTCHDNLKMFDEAVTDVLSGKAPQEVCQALKFCTPIDAGSEVLSGLLDFTGGDFMPTRCTTCQQNTLLLASLVTRPDSLDTYKREINTVCRLIPESNECELLMKHQDAIIDLLKKKEDVDAICTRIGECAFAAEEVQKEKPMSVGCLFCEFTADLLKHAKDSEEALREAKATLETICTVMPPLARCDVLSSKFDELLSLMREGKSPSEACHTIALCDTDFVFSPSLNVKEDPIVQAFEKARQSMSNAVEIQ